MKYTFIINQAGVVRCDLLGRVDLPALCFLDYLGGWFFSKNARRAVVDGREYIWLRYEHAVDELPLLFNPQAGIPTRKNQLSRLVQSLRNVGLVETVKVGRDLYLRPSTLAAALANSRERIVTKSTPTVTPAHDDTVTSSRDDTITPNRDDSSPTIIDQTTINQTTIRKPIPHNPPVGESVIGQPSFSSQQAEEIYAAYPKHVAKPNALRAIKRALKSVTADYLLQRTKLFAATYNGEVQFIPYPASWFNGARFNDDPATWRRSPPTNGKHQPGIIKPGSHTNQIGKL